MSSIVPGFVVATVPAGCLLLLLWLRLLVAACPPCANCSNGVDAVIGCASTLLDVTEFAVNTDSRVYEDNR